MLRVLEIFRRRSEPIRYHGPLLESFNHDGVQIARQRARRRRTLPLRQVGFLLLAFLAFKVFLYLDLGPVAYAGKIEDLGQGSRWEQVAARAMALDPVSEWILHGIKFGRW